MFRLKIIKKTDKKTRILAAAEKLLAGFGFEGTSTSQISKESGANIAMINYYLGSKEGVFLELIEAKISNHKNILQEICLLKVPDKEKIMKLIEYYVTKVLANPDFQKMMYKEPFLHQRPEIFVKIKKAIAENHKVIEEIIDTGVADGNFRKTDVHMLISTIVGVSFIVSQHPDCIIDNPKFDINNKKHLEELSLRITGFLQEPVKSYLMV